MKPSIGRVTLRALTDFELPRWEVNLVSEGAKTTRPLYVGQTLEDALKAVERGARWIAMFNEVDSPIEKFNKALESIDDLNMDPEDVFSMFAGRRFQVERE